MKLATSLLTLFAILTLPTFAADSVHDFKVKDIDGKEVALSGWKGKPVLFVNVASRCGFTKQYDGLQAVWERYRDQGFVLLGVPSNDFGGQEPGSEAEIKTFCEVNFNIDFPLTTKQHVKGDQAHPFYQWARSTLGENAAPRWNFHKYLINRDGMLAQAFATPERPDGPKVVAAIEALLAQQGS